LLPAAQPASAERALAGWPLALVASAERVAPPPEPRLRPARADVAPAAWQAVLAVRETATGDKAVPARVDRIPPRPHTPAPRRVAHAPRREAHGRAPADGPSCSDSPSFQWFAVGGDKVRALASAMSCPAPGSQSVAKIPHGQHPAAQVTDSTAPQRGSCVGLARSLPAVDRPRRPRPPGGGPTKRSGRRRVVSRLPVRCQM
jgi:hypothetical protein